MRGSSFRQVWIEPFAQRCCCDLNEFISTGTSAGDDDVGQEHEPPAAQLRAVAEVEILGQRVVLPAAGVGDRFAPPDAGRAVEIEEAAGAVAAAVLEHEVRVEQDRLDLGEQRVVLVDVAPARLHHADLRVGREVRQRPRQEILRRNEVGVENGDELAACDSSARPRARRPCSRCDRPGAGSVMSKPRAAWRRTASSAMSVVSSVESSSTWISSSSRG